MGGTSGAAGPGGEYGAVGPEGRSDSAAGSESVLGESGMAGSLPSRWSPSPRRPEGPHGRRPLREMPSRATGASGPAQVGQELADSIQGRRVHLPERPPGARLQQVYTLSTRTRVGWLSVPESRSADVTSKLSGLAPAEDDKATTT